VVEISLRRYLPLIVLTRHRCDEERDRSPASANTGALCQAGHGAQEQQTRGEPPKWQL